MNAEKIAQLIEKTKEEIDLKGDTFLKKYFPSKYIDYINAYPVTAAYGYVSVEVKTICDEITKRFGKQFLEKYHKLVLLSLIKENHKKVYNEKIPEGVKLIYNINFKRILGEIETESYKRPYLYSNDKFRKDLAVCSMRLIPVGSRKIHLSVLSKSFLFKKGISQYIGGLMFIIFELKGLKPLYEMHIDSKDPHLLKEFNEKGLKNSYRLIGEFLKKQSHVKGVFGSAWYYDPIIEHVSPRLAYLRKIPTENGGKLFYLGSDNQAVRDSTLRSKTRRRLYEEGKYIPTRYLIVWSRNKIIDWSKKK